MLTRLREIGEFKLESVRGSSKCAKVPLNVFPIRRLAIPFAVPIGPNLRKNTLLQGIL